MNERDSNLICENENGCVDGIISENSTMNYSYNGNEVIRVAETLLEMIELYYTPLLIVLGCIGNALSVYVFFGSKLRKLSSSYYLSALAVSDTGFLIAHFITWLNMVDLPLFNKSGFCQLAVYASNVCSFISVWLVVLFTVERFIAVRYPLHRAAVCTVARAKIFIITLITLALPSYSPYLAIAAPQYFNLTLNEQNSTTKVCALVAEWREIASILNHVDFCLTLILPFFIIVVLNTLICRTVRKLAKIRRAMTTTSRKRFFNRPCRHRSSTSNNNNNNNNNNNYYNQTRLTETDDNSSCNTTIHSKCRNNNRNTNNSVHHQHHHHNNNNNNSSQTKVTQMLLIVSTVFICLNLPSYLLRIWVYLNNNKTDRDSHEYGITTLLQHYFNILFATNFGINFVLYCISGQNFRKALYSLLRPTTYKRAQEHTQTTVISETTRVKYSNSTNRRNGSFIEMQEINPSDI